MVCHCTLAFLRPPLAPYLWLFARQYAPDQDGSGFAAGRTEGGGGGGGTRNRQGGDNAGCTGTRSRDRLLLRPLAPALVAVAAGVVAAAALVSSCHGSTAAADGSVLTATASYSGLAESEHRDKVDAGDPPPSKGSSGGASAETAECKTRRAALVSSS